MKRKPRAPGYKVLVRLKKVEEKKEVTSKGGIILETKTDKDLEREQEGVTEAHVVDIGPSAFKLQSTGDTSHWCEIGDCVLIGRYAGTILPDLGDGYTYRSIADLDIQAVFPDDKIEVGYNG